MPPRSAPRPTRPGTSSARSSSGATAKSKPTPRSAAKKGTGRSTASSSSTIEDMEDMVHSFTADEIPLIRSSLLTWFDANKRDLPWRRTRCMEGVVPATLAGTASSDEDVVAGAVGSSAPAGGGDQSIPVDADRQDHARQSPTTEFSANSSTESPPPSPISRKRPARAAAHRGSVKRAKLSAAMQANDSSGASDKECSGSSSDLSDVMSDSSAEEDDAVSDSDSDSDAQPPRRRHQPPAPPAAVASTAMVAASTLANAHVFPPHVDRNAPGQHAYEVWVSEIMCQQTQVATASPYYIKWMSKWPTVFDLARASQEEVTQTWSGLGYYSRAHRLLTSSHLLVSTYSGILPSDPALLAAHIPGIGKYTAGAIASIAYGVAAPLVDGNVIRVLSRLRALGGDPKAKSVGDLHWALAGQLVEGCERPGDWNEALMELGARVCTPTSPACAECPVREWCWARRGTAAGCTCVHCQTWTQVEGEAEAAAAAGDVTIYPRKPVKKAPRDETVHVAVVHHVVRGRYCIVQRPAQGLLANMWEYVCDSDKDVVEGMVQALVAAEEGSEVKRRKAVGSVTHLFSHIKMTLEVEYVAITGAAVEEEEEEDVGKLANALGKRAVKWVTEEEMEIEAVSTGMKKVFKLVKQNVKGLSAVGEGENEVEVSEEEDVPKKRTAKGKGKAAKADPKQPSIASFFKKK